MKHILVPTDFSNNAYSALFYATQLQKGIPCTFHLLNVYNAFTSLKRNVAGKPTVDQLALESEEGLESTFHRIKLDDSEPDHSFELLSEHGDLVTIVSALTKELEIDLVVIGNKGRSELEAIVFGSNALNLIGKVKKCPVLTVPKEVDFDSSLDIAFVTDYGRPYDAGLLHSLVLMAQRHSSKIRVMHVNETRSLTRTQEINQGILLEYLKPFKRTEHWMPLYKSKATSINDFLEELNIGMLVMINYEHNFFEKLTHEPVIKRMAYNPDIPFLIIPARD